MEENKSEFQFKEFKILKSFISINEDHKKFKDFNFGLDINGIYKKSDNEFKLYLNMMIENEDCNFQCEIKSLGLFLIDTNNEDFIKNYLYTNAPALIFPYLRAYISTLTTQSGIDSIVLPTMNLSMIVQNDFKDKIIIID